MKATKPLMTAAFLAVSGFSFVPCIYAQATDAPADNRSTMQKAEDATVNAAKKTGEAVKNTADKMEGKMKGEGTAMAPDAGDIRDTLASATEAFIKKGTFDDFVERLVDADRNRIGKDNYAEQDHADLDAATQAFRDAWKAKYNQDFDIKDEKVVYNDQSFHIMQSEIGDNAQPAAGRVDVNTNQGNVTANANTDKPADTNKNDAGRNIATVTVQGVGGMPELQVPMIHEAPDSWKIDAADIDGPKLKDNFIAHLNALTAAKDQWPADVNEAYRVVTAHALMAVLDKPAQ